MTQQEIDDRLNAISDIMSEVFGQKAEVTYYRKVNGYSMVMIYAAPAKGSSSKSTTLSSGKLADPVDDILAAAHTKAQSMIATHRAQAAEFGMVAA